MTTTNMFLNFGGKWGSPPLVQSKVILDTVLMWNIHINGIQLVTILLGQSGYH